MKKPIILYIVLFVIGVIIFFYGLNNYIYKQKQGEAIMENSSNTEITDNSVQITPISHATFVLDMAGATIFNDPVGEAATFAEFGEPDIILISDIHGDHLDADTVQALATERTTIIVPQAVRDALPASIPGLVVVLANGETTTQNGISIEAIPMYNMPESTDSPHTKGRGNGYVLDAAGRRIYIAGDTGGTPEMRSLQDIDVAFVPMNLPYTMGVEDAADAVLAFKPAKVIPYHYRGPDGLADINKFGKLVNAGDSNITVELLNFYPEQ